MALRYLSQITDIVRKIEHDGDPITYSKQSQYVSQLMMEACKSEVDPRDMFLHLNKLALESEDVAINLPHVLTARHMESIRFPNSQTNVRNEVLRLLQGNFANHQVYKSDRPEKAYNSLTLLGEFYNLLRVAQQPISILGQSLLQLLIQELDEVLQGKAHLRPELAKLVSTQITINGQLFKKHELEKLNSLLDTIRRVIVEADGKSRRGKAYLMLSFDLFYHNFTASAMSSLQKVYGGYFDESPPAFDPFAEDPQPTCTEDAATNTSRTNNDDQYVPEKRQRVEIAVQTEVAICDVFRAGPAIVSPVERASNATTYTNLTISRGGGDSSSKATPPSPSATNSSGTRKSKIDPRIRNVRIGRVYPKPVFNSSSTATVSPPRALSCVSTVDGGDSSSEVAKLSIKNVTLHELAMMKENPSHLNRITNGYLDRLAPPSEVNCPSIKSSSEYTGKENESERMESVSTRGGGGGGEGNHQQQQQNHHSHRRNASVGGGSPKKSPTSNHNNSHANGGGGSATAGSGHRNGNGVASKFQIEENFDIPTYDPSFFDDYVPHNGHASSKSFLQFLENK